MKPSCLRACLWQAGRGRRAFLMITGLHAPWDRVFLVSRSFLRLVSQKDLQLSQRLVVEFLSVIQRRSVKLL